MIPVSEVQAGDLIRATPCGYKRRVTFGVIANLGDITGQGQYVFVSGTRHSAARGDATHFRSTAFMFKPDAEVELVERDSA